MKDYWKQYWNNSQIIREPDSHRQVGRTMFGDRIHQDTWNKTLQFLLDKLELSQHHKILDLCAGNGLITAALIDRVSSAVAVDISETLLNSFVVKSEDIKKIQSDILKYRFPENHFDRILFYFSAQHFSEPEIAAIVQQSYRSLKKEGIMYIGDVPDINKKWTFYDKKEYRKFLFDTFINKEQHIGTWFGKEFFKFLGEYAGFSSTQIIDQPPYMINSAHRFDVILKK